MSICHLNLLAQKDPGKVNLGNQLSKPEYILGLMIGFGTGLHGAPHWQHRGSIGQHWDTIGMGN